MGIGGMILMGMGMEMGMGMSGMNQMGMGMEMGMGQMGMRMRMGMADMFMMVYNSGDKGFRIGLEGINNSGYAGAQDLKSPETKINLICDYFRNKKKYSCELWNNNW